MYWVFSGQVAHYLCVTVNFLSNSMSHLILLMTFHRYRKWNSEKFNSLKSHKVPNLSCSWTQVWLTQNPLISTIHKHPFWSELADLPLPASGKVGIGELLGHLVSRWDLRMSLSLSEKHLPIIAVWRLEAKKQLPSTSPVGLVVFRRWRSTPTPAWASRPRWMLGKRNPFSPENYTTRAWDISELKSGSLWMGYHLVLLRKTAGKGARGSMA